MVVIDATNLLLMLRPDTPVSVDLDGISVDQPKERIEFLVQKLDREKTKIIIPTPALSEALVRAGSQASQQIIEQLQKLAVFRIEPFDTRAALEVAAMTRDAVAKGKKRGNSTATWAKVKYDRQIVAIARVTGAAVIYSDDSDIASMAAPLKIKVVKLRDLPIPPRSAQIDMFKQQEVKVARDETSAAEEGPHEAARL